MCGRSSLHDAPVSVLERFSLPPVIPGFKPRYNIAPTQEQLTIFAGEDGHAQLRPLRWGLVPAWAQDRSIGARMINARSDTLATKDTWEFLLRKRRWAWALALTVLIGDAVIIGGLLRLLIDVGLALVLFQPPVRARFGLR